jgi:hypothetical protein
MLLAAVAGAASALADQTDELLDPSTAVPPGRGPFAGADDARQSRPDNLPKAVHGTLARAGRG